MLKNQYTSVGTVCIKKQLKIVCTFCKLYSTGACIFYENILPIK